MKGAMGVGTWLRSKENCLSVWLCNLTWDYAIRSSMITSSEFKKSIWKKVYSSICTGVILWSCCVHAKEFITSTVNLIHYDILDIAQTESNAQLLQLQISCSVSPRTAGPWIVQGLRWNWSAWVPWTFLWEHSAVWSETLPGIWKPLVNVHMKQWQQSG